MGRRVCTKIERGKEKVKGQEEVEEEDGRGSPEDQRKDSMVCLSRSA